MVPSTVGSSLSRPDTPEHSLCTDTPPTPAREVLDHKTCHTASSETPALLSAFLFPRRKPETEDLLKKKTIKPTHDMAASRVGKATEDGN